MFHLIRKDGARFDIEADAICDDGYGTNFELLRGDKLVGRLQGDFNVWWKDPSSSKENIVVYCIEIDDDIIRIAADSTAVIEEPRRQQVFKVSNDTVGIVYVDYHSWWIEQPETPA